MATRPSAAAIKLPADAVEVARVRDAWGVRGWFFVQPYSASAEALFHGSCWYLVQGVSHDHLGTAGTRTSQRLNAPVSSVVLALTIAEVRHHRDGLVARANEVLDRNHAETLKGARVFMARGDFPPLAEDEYYWVDLMGLTVTARDGTVLGVVGDVISSGPQTVLVVRSEASISGGKPVERMIPFVAAWVDGVDRAAGNIRVAWQPDYD